MGNAITQLKPLFQNFIKKTKKIVLASDNGLDRLPREIQLEMLSLLTEQSKPWGEYRIRKPSTKLVLDLPYPQHKPSLLGITFLTSTGTYIVVSTYNGKHQGKNGGCEVLNTGSANFSWRALEISHFPNLGEITSALILDQICHCLVIYENGSGNCEIVSIDLNKEVSTLLKVTKNFQPDWQNVKLVSWNKKPSVYSVVEHELHVWVLEDYKKQKWADNKTIVPLTFLKEDPSIKECYIQYGVQSGIVWFKVGYNKMVHCMESKKVVTTICPP